MAEVSDTMLAEALGLVRSDKMMRCPVTYPNLGQNLITTAYCWLVDGEPFCAVDNFGTWLASPAGEKAVEKQIIIECKRLGYAFDYHWWIDDKGNERHAAGYGMQGCREGLHTFRSRISMLEDSVECSTKSAAHTAALLRLAERSK